MRGIRFGAPPGGGITVANMAKRLVDLYLPGDEVEITFGGDDWWPGRVLKGDHPGLWVVTENERVWFVTNGRRIRKKPSTGSATAP